MNRATSDTTPNVPRRKFLRSATALGAAPFLNLPYIPPAGAAPEATRLRFVIDEGICLAPQLLSAELLRLEGFSEVDYVRVNYEEYSSISAVLAAGKGDIAQDAAINLLPLVDLGHPLVVLSGVHAGCWELFGGPQVRAIRDLRGKRLPISAIGAEEHLLATSLSAYLGMDPRKDLHFVTIPLFDDQVKAFVAKDVDAIFAFPPQPQRLRAQGIGRVIIDAAHDRPFTQYFCCVVSANRNFTDRNPAATKRALRAILKATDLCAEDPERAARYLVEKGYEPRYETAFEVLRKLPYARWRDFNAEDTLRFHALRLHEVGMIKSTPGRLIAEHTDWRFLDELKMELKT